LTQQIEAVREAGDHQGPEQTADDAAAAARRAFVSSSGPCRPRGKRPMSRAISHRPSEHMIVRPFVLARRVLLLLGFLALGLAAAAAAPAPERSVDMAKVLQPGPLPELSLGNPNGVPIVEYGSLTCPHCAAFSREVMPKLKAQYIDSGKVHFIFREFSRNPLDVAAFVLARCVGEDKALATIDLLFAVQDKWAFVDSPLEPLLAAVRPTGLSREKAMACLKDQSKADAMQKIVKTAEDVVKVEGTPTFVIDGKVYGGELSMPDFDAILKPLVK
jgi:protein-disulfide isomerase